MLGTTDDEREFVVVRRAAQISDAMKKWWLFFNISHKAAKYTRIRVPRPIRKLPINVHDMKLIVKILKIHK